MRVVAVLAVAAVLVSAAAAEARRPASHEAVPVAPCVKDLERSGAVRIRTSDGVKLVGVVLGRGKVGIAVGHERNGTLCNWLPFARRLAAQGYRVVAFDHRGHGDSDYPPYPRNLALDKDVVAAVGELRRRGSTRFVVMGASMGATVALVAAPQLGRSLAAAVDLSGPAQYVRLDAIPAVRRMSAPGLFAVGRFDTGFVADTRKLEAASGHPGSRLVIRQTGAHGTAMLADPSFSALVLAFVKRHSG